MFIFPSHIRSVISYQVYFIPDMPPKQDIHCRFQANNEDQPVPVSGSGYPPPARGFGETDEVCVHPLFLNLKLVNETIEKKKITEVLAKSNKGRGKK